MKMAWERKRFWEDDSVLVNATAVRIPVFTGHSEAVHLETREKLTAEDARKLLAKAPGVCLVDERAPGDTPPRPRTRPDAMKFLSGAFGTTSRTRAG